MIFKATVFLSRKNALKILALLLICMLAPFFPLLSAFPVLPETALSLSGSVGTNGWYTSNVTVSLYPSESNTEPLTIEYTFYNQPWTQYTQPLTIYAEGQTTIYYRAHDQSDNTEPIKRQNIDIDKTPPNGSITIEADAKECFSTQVNLVLSAFDLPLGPITQVPSGYIHGVPSGVSEMRFSNTGTTWSEWQTYSESKTWNLMPAKGEKTVYAQVRDNAGLVSDIFFDKIDLVVTKDKTPPNTTVIISGSKTNQGLFDSEAIITLRCNDDLSGVENTQFRFNEAAWINYSSPFIIDTEGATTIFYRSIDFMGNLETEKSVTVNITKLSSQENISVWAYAGVLLVSIITFFVGLRLIRKKGSLKSKG